MKAHYFPSFDKFLNDTALRILNASISAFLLRRSPQNENFQFEEINHFIVQTLKLLMNFLFCFTVYIV